MRRDNEQLLHDEAFKNTSFGNFLDLTDLKNSFNKRLEIKDITYSLRRKLIEDADCIFHNQEINNGIRLALGNNSFLKDVHDDIGKQINKLI